MKNCLALLCGLIFLSSCKEPSTFKELPSGPIKHQLIAVARTTAGVRARGFLGATPPKSGIFFEVGPHNKAIISNEDGSFDHELILNSHEARADLTFSLDAKHYQVGYEIKDVAQVLKRMSKKIFSTDFEMDSIVVKESHAAVLSTNAALLNIHPIDGTWALKKKSLATIVLNPNNKAKLYPRATLLTKNHAIVALYGTHELMLIDREKKSVIYKSRLLDKNGELYTFENKPPLLVKEPLKADGQNNSTSIAKSFAHSPEVMFALDETTFLVAFANYYQFADPSTQSSSVVGLGVVALVSIDNNQLTTKAIVQLPFKNPRYFIAKNNQEIWLSCSGVYRDINSFPMKSDDAGLVKLLITANNNIEIKHHIPLKDFSPAKPALVSNKIIIPLAYGNQIAVIDDTAAEIKTDDIKTPSFHRSFAFTLAEPWHDDIVFLSSNEGSLVAYSLADSFFPFPFSEPIRINPTQEKSISISPTELIFRHGENEENYKPGYSAWVLSTTQHKIFAFDFLEIFGP